MKFLKWEGGSDKGVYDKGRKNSRPRTGSADAGAHVSGWAMSSARNNSIIIVGLRRTELDDNY